MDELLHEYLPILIFLGVATGLSVIMLAASYTVAQQHPDSEKLSAYECGFEAFEDARGRFDVRFSLVAILFIIFDLDVAFLFPWPISLEQLGVFGLWSMIVLLAILTVGYVYDCKKSKKERRV